MSPDIPDDDDRTVIRPPARPSADAGNGLPMGTRLAEFELTQYLAEGGFGIVYLAFDHSLQRRVALKEYMPASLARRGTGQQVTVRSERFRDTFEAGRSSFVNEARLLASFDHPSLLKVYRFWEGNGTAYMVMPYLEGVTLKDHLKSLPGPPDEAWMRALLAPLTDALQVLHAQSCYHRDIAPDNIMLLAGSQQAVLMDFGASRRVIGDMTHDLTVILKPGYAPVEQYAEVPGMKQGPWTDVYALAAVVHFMVMGKTPPPSVARLLNDSYRPLAEAAAGRCSPEFLGAVDRALAVRPDDRTASVDRFRADLGLAPPAEDGRPPLTLALPGVAHPAARAPSAVGGSVQPPAPPSPPAGRRRALPLPLLAAGLLVLALGAGAYWALRPGTGAPTLTGPAGAAATAAATAAADTGASGPGAAAAGVASAGPSPTASSPFDMPAEFRRVVLAQAPGFEVGVTAEKTRLRIGHDLMSFTVRSNRDGFLYVQGHASDGSVMLLYPNATVGTPRIVKGQAMTLPQPPIVFDTTEPEGPTHLLVMVSERERDLSVLQPKKLGPFRQLPTGADAARIAAAHAGDKVPLQAGRAICASAAPCDDVYGAALITFDTVR